MLSRSTTHPDTSKYDPVNFTVSLMYAALFIIIFDITECRLIRQRTDRSCLKGLSLPEDNFGVLYVPYSGTLRKSSGRYPALYFP